MYMICRSRNGPCVFSAWALLAVLSISLLPQCPAGLLPGNIWPNPTVESDSNHDGVPDFWHRGGSDTGIDVWTTSLSVSLTHAFGLNDTSTTAYGEWYSDLLNVGGGVNYQLRYNLRYAVTNVTPMRVTVNFYTSANTLLFGVSYLFSGQHDFWEEITQQFVTPANAAKAGLSFTSGGGADVTGQAWLDDISVAPVTGSNSVLPYLEAFPTLPNPLVIRDWKQTALDYHRLAFDRTATGTDLPLLYDYTAGTAAGYSGPAFALPSYIGQSPSSGEALTALGAVLGGTLAGLNMADLDGIDRVQQCEVFYSVINGHGLVLNNVNSKGSGSAWYDISPSALFYQIAARYPGRPSFDTKIRAIGDSWLAALPLLSNNWEHTGFDFKTMSPVDRGWTEPDMALGIAWLEFMTFLRFGEPQHLAVADTCLRQMESRAQNPFYESLALFGPLLAARMNAEMDRQYSTAKYLNWVFSPGSDARPGWGCEAGHWGNYDAYGLIGSTTDTSGYAFSMNSFTAAGLIAPVVRYEPQYARLLGRWLLHVAANANLFYPDTLPANMQSSAAWPQQTGITSVSYEGVRHFGATTPYATGDAADPVLDLNPYGAWGSGYLAALFRTSNVPGILLIDCVASDTLPPPALPTSLIYNPYPDARQVSVNVGSAACHLYDAVNGAFIATNATATATISVPPDTALVLVQCPASAPLTRTNRRLMVSGIVLDYWNAAKDTDADGLADWWESRYYGNLTNAQPAALAANGFNNLQAYLLGLDPTNPDSTFKARVAIEPLTGFPVLTWNSVGGKSYTVQYADAPGPLAGFLDLLTLQQTNVPPGVESQSQFVDDYSLTGSPPGPGGRYYRIMCVTPGNP